MEIDYASRVTEILHLEVVERESVTTVEQVEQLAGSVRREPRCLQHGVKECVSFQAWLKKNRLPVNVEV